MKTKITLLFTLFVITLNMNAQTLQAPKAKKIQKKLEKHGDIRIDNYYWLNERENPEVIAYLNAENDYTKQILKPTESFQKELFEEMKGRIKEDDSSVPYKFNGYWYQTEYIKGGEYPIYKRWPENAIPVSPEEEKNFKETMFDVNEMAKGYKYYQLGGISISSNNQIAAFGVDTVSRRIYHIQFKNLITGEIYPEKIENTTGGSTWANDNKTIFYTRKDKALRSYQIWKHILGTDVKEDKLVYEEKDETFSCFVYKTKSKKYIIIGSSATLSDEYRFIPADNPDAEWKMFQPRERNLEYSIDHFGDNFYIRTNKDKAENFKVMKTSVQKTEKENWQEVIPHRKEVLLEGFEIFNNFLVLEERKEGLTQINIKQWNPKGQILSEEYLPFGESVFTAYTTTNVDFDTDWLRYAYNSMTTPSSVIEYNMKTKEKKVLKEQEVLGGKFDKNNYISERIWVTARDGKKIPVSLVRRKDAKPSAATPLLQYAYGSYGYSLDPTFSTTRLSLLDRGFIYVIAHIRGGEELGRQWYEDGKFFNKKNTFFDFIYVSKYLIDNNYTSPNHLYAMGGSAGGLLMGAVINYNPELYKGVIAAVPFVDVVTTMLDDTIPLTTGEYDEWGNPNEKAYYDYMKSYSPYDNVEAKNYPNLLITTGLHDSQVQYWEPAKWIAKLREMKTDNNILIMDCNMDTGHGGASGRFESLKETALEYAFLLMLEGKLN